MDDPINSAMSDGAMPTYSKPAMMLQCPNCHNIVFVGSKNIVQELLEMNKETDVYEVVRDFLRLPKNIVLPVNWKNTYIPCYPDVFPCTCGTLLRPTSINEPIYELAEHGQNHTN